MDERNSYITKEDVMGTLGIIKSYVISLVVFLAVDIFWLGVAAKPLYGTYLNHLMAPKVNWPAALIFYALFIVGLLIFVISPAIEADSLMHALIYGALFGFFTYMTYELTNYAVIRDWPLPIVLIDIAWGTALGACVSFCTTLIMRHLK